MCLFLKTKAVLSAQLNSKHITFLPTSHLPGQPAPRVYTLEFRNVEQVNWNHMETLAKKKNSKTVQCDSATIERKIVADFLIKFT